MISHHPAKFGGHRHYGSGDMMLVVVEGQDSTCSRLDLPLLFIFLRHMECHAHIHENSGRGHNNLPVCPMKDSRSWSHMSTRTTNGTYLKNLFCQSVEKKCLEKGKEKNEWQLQNVFY